MLHGLTLVLSNSAFVSFRGESGGPGPRLGRGATCREEGLIIQTSVCTLEWGEECTVARKTVAKRVVMETQCEDREVMDCKVVQVVYQEFPRSVKDTSNNSFYICNSISTFKS